MQNYSVSNTDFVFFIQSIFLGKRLFIIEKKVETIFDKNEKIPIKKTLTITLPHDFLMPGSYSCEIGILSSMTEYIDRKESVGTFEVIFGNSHLLKYGNRELGYVFPNYTIDVE